MQVTISSGQKDKPDSKVYGESETIFSKNSARRPAARCMRAILIEMQQDAAREQDGCNRK